MLKEAYSTMLKFGVEHDDLKLDNYHFVGDGPDRIMILDLELACNLENPAHAERICWFAVDFLTRQYIRHQSTLRTIRANDLHQVT